MVNYARKVLTAGTVFDGKDMRSWRCLIPWSWRSRGWIVLEICWQFRHIKIIKDHASIGRGRHRSESRGLHCSQGFRVKLRVAWALWDETPIDTACLVYHKLNNQRTMQRLHWPMLRQPLLQVSIIWGSWYFRLALRLGNWGLRKDYAILVNPLFVMIVWTRIHAVVTVSRHCHLAVLKQYLDVSPAIDSP